MLTHNVLMGVQTPLFTHRWRFRVMGLIALLVFIVGCSAAATPTDSRAGTSIPASPAQVEPSVSPAPTSSAVPGDTLAPVSPTRAVLPMPTATVTLDVPEPDRPLLMAHFMPWYQAPEVSGYWGWHWTMDHFMPSKVDENGHRDIASYYQPLTGPYDSSDDAILEYQVLLMKLSGIDGVIVDWYGQEPFWDYGVLNASTHKLFDYVKRAGLRFAICYEDQTVKHMVDHHHLSVGDVYTHGQAVMAYLQETWFREDAYLKVNGRPVLLVFGPQYFKNASDWDKLFSGLPERPALITLDGHTESAALSSYPWPPMWAGTGGVLSQERLEDYLVSFYKKAERWDYLVAGAFPGFKDIYAEAGLASETRYLDPRDGETFRLTLRMALEHQPDVIQLITWNDYGESTSIEPTEEYGYRYLELVQETRRGMGADEFSFSAEDLRLPLWLFQARKRYADDEEARAQLDQVFDAILGGDLEQARSILAHYPVGP